MRRLRRRRRSGFSESRPALRPRWRRRTTTMMMTRMETIERPGIAARLFFRIGARMFGQVPTPQRLMAHRLPLMLGIGGLYGAIEWFGKIDALLRALLNVQ